MGLKRSNSPGSAEKPIELASGRESAEVVRAGNGEPAHAVLRDGGAGTCASDRAATSCLITVDADFSTSHSLSVEKRHSAAAICAPGVGSDQTSGSTELDVPVLRRPVLRDRTSRRIVCSSLERSADSPLPRSLCAPISFDDRLDCVLEKSKSASRNRAARSQPGDV